MKVRCWQHLSTSEIDSMMDSQPVLLVGSAVSDFIPTNLPSGGTVAWELLTMLANPGTGNSWPEWLVADARRLPFEAVLEAYPDQRKLPEIIARLFGNPDVQPNSLHVAIGGGLEDRVFSALITTNYDLAFDNYFSNDNKSVFTICRQSEFQEWNDRESHKQPYWKIHGSARHSYEDSIVFNLAHERRMDRWKRDLLARLLDDRTIIFLGYSGRDFDICPELACTENIRSAVWLRYRWVEDGLRGLNANQARVLERASGTVVIGDLHNFLSRLRSHSLPNLGRRNVPVEIKDCFDVSLFPEWRVRILDRLACPSFGIPLLLSLAEKNAPAQRSLYVSMLTHAGKHADAARVVESQLKEANAPTDQLIHLTNAANIYYVCGARLRSKLCFRRAKKLARLINADSYARACLSKIELMYWMRRARWANKIPCSRLKSWIANRATAHYRSAVEVFERTNLDNLYIVQHDAERIGIASHDGFASAANLGFASLGLRGMECLKQRDRIMSLQGPLSAANRTVCVEWITRAKHYGWKPETWKWAWILIWQGEGWSSRQLWHDWWHNFWQTDYTNSFRLIMFAKYLLEGIKQRISRGGSKPIN